MSCGGARRSALGAACAWLLAAGSAPAGTLTASEAAGKRLYVEGIGTAGTVAQARIGIANMALPASALPCVNCHGSDGRGRPEGGLLPPDITWNELTKPYGHLHENGRQHGAFDIRSLRRALTEGKDPAGQALDPAMPRYALSDEDLRVLAAYLARIGSETDPGLAADRLRIGTLLPLTGADALEGRALRDLLTAIFERINAAGGVFGRRLELVAADYGADPAAARASLQALLREDGVFALLTPFAAGLKTELEELARRSGLPVLAPLLAAAEVRSEAAAPIFHLWGGTPEMAQVLAEFALARGQHGASIALVHRAGSAAAPLAATVAARIARRGGAPPQFVALAPGEDDAAALAARLRASGIAAVILLDGAVDAATLARAAAGNDWHPYLLLPDTLAPPGILELPAPFADRLFVAYPTVPSDRERQASADLAGLLSRIEGAAGLGIAAVTAHAAAAVLLEALKRTGRELSRRKLIATLETMQDFAPGLAPAVSYNTQRRIGALGGHVLAVDLSQKRFRLAGPWIRLD